MTGPSACRLMQNAPGMPYHEGHLLRCDIFSCNDEVPFILAVGRVEDHDELAILCKYPRQLCVEPLS